MLSRVTWVSLWFLFIFLILKGETEKQLEPEMYCDDEYRTKYIVSTSLFNVTNNNETKIVEEKSMLNPSTNVTEKPEQFNENDKDINAEKSIKNFDQDEKFSISQINNHLSGNKQTTNKLKTRPGKITPVSSHQHHQHPLVVLVNTQINITVTRGDFHQESSRPGRVKRDTEDDNQKSCIDTRRIIGGSAVLNIETVPYIVFVDSGCAGTILSNFWVLTAAHCIGVTPPKYVYGGNIKLFSGCKHKIEKIVVHPNYSEKTYRADLTLLKLYQPFAFSPAIKPMLLDSGMPKTGSCGIISGWGSTTVGGKMEYNLRTTKLPIIERNKCKMFPFIDEDQFCAGFQDAHTDTCQGDSGGPFVVNNLLVGIVSFGYKCAMREIPGVYVSVPYYRNWIENITGVE